MNTPSPLAIGLLLILPPPGVRGAEPESAAKGRPERPRMVLKGHTDGIFSVCYSPDGSLLATGGRDKAVQLWDARTGKSLRTMTGHTASVYRCVFSPDGSRLASASSDKTICLWDPRDGKVLHVFKGHTGDVYDLAFSPDGARLASTSGDFSVQVWDVKSGKAIHVLKEHKARAVGIAMAQDGRYLASCSPGDGSVKQDEVVLWDLASGSVFYKIPGTDEGAIGVSFSPDGRRLAGTCEKEGVKVWEVATGHLSLELKGHTLDRYHVAFSPCGRRLASTSGSWSSEKGGEVKVWDLPTGAEALSFSGYPAPIWCVAFSPDGQNLATACGMWNKVSPGEVWVWDLSCLPKDNRPVPVVGEKDLERWWNDLAGENPMAAYRAIWNLSAASRRSLPYLMEHAVVPPTTTRAEIDRLIINLDDDDFPVRERASAELSRLGAVARPELQKALRSRSAEVHRRASLILQGMTAGPALSREEMRGIRLLEALGHMEGEDIRPLLRKLASGSERSPVSLEAKLALERLEKVR